MKSINLLLALSAIFAANNIFAETTDKGGTVTVKSLRGVYQQTPSSAVEEVDITCITNPLGIGTPNISMSNYRGMYRNSSNQRCFVYARSSATSITTGQPQEESTTSAITRGIRQVGQQIAQSLGFGTEQTRPSTQTTSGSTGTYGTY